jgi:hypothetical protein
VFDAEANSNCSALRNVLDMARRMLDCSFVPANGEDIEEEAHHDMEKVIYSFEQEGTHGRTRLSFNVFYPDGTSGIVHYFKARLPHRPHMQAVYGFCCSLTECWLCNRCCELFSPHPYHSIVNQCFTFGMWSWYKELAKAIVEEHQHVLCCDIDYERK